MPRSRTRSKSLSTAAAARELGVSPPMILKLQARGFLGRPFTKAKLTAAWAKWEKDKATRAAVRASPAMLDDALREERIRALELGNAIRARDLIRLDHVAMGVEVVMGPLKDNAAGLVSRRVADGEDRQALETEIDGALERVSAESGEAPGRMPPARAVDAPIELPPADTVAGKDLETLRRIEARRLTNAALEARHFPASMAFDLIDGLVKDVEDSFAPIPHGLEHVVEPLRSRAASVIECLQDGIDPETLT